MSLVTTPVSQLAVCAQCSSTRVTHISMTLTDGSERRVRLLPQLRAQDLDRGRHRPRASPRS